MDSEEQVLKVLRAAQPRWLGERRALIAQSAIRPGPRKTYPDVLVRQPLITAPFEGAGGFPISSAETPEPTPPPTFPHPTFPTGVYHTPYPSPDDVDIALLVVHGQDVGYPNTWSGLWADEAYIWHFHGDPTPYRHMYGWDVPGPGGWPGGPQPSDPAFNEADLPPSGTLLVGNIRFGRVDIYIDNSPGHDGWYLRSFVHIGDGYRAAGPAYNFYQEDYGFGSST